MGSSPSTGQNEETTIFQSLSQIPDKIKQPSVQLYTKISTQLSSVDILDSIKQHYQNALKNAPNNPQILTKLAMIYDQSNNTQKSKTLLSKALDQQPNNVETLNFMAVIQCKDGLFNQANNRIKFAITKIQQNQHSYKSSGTISDQVLANLHNNLGNTYRYKDDNTEAVKQFQIAINLDPQNSLFYVNCAITLSHPQIQNYQKAYDYLLEAQRLLNIQKQANSTQFNSYVLDQIVEFRQDIQEWNFKRKHNYITPQEREHLQQKLHILQKNINSLFSSQLQNNSLVHSIFSMQYDKKLAKVSAEWRRSNMQICCLCQIDRQIFELYEQIAKNFSIIPFNILAYSLKKRQSKQLSINQIQQEISCSLIQLSKKYPPSSCLTDVQSRIQQFGVPNQQKPNLFDKNFFSSYENMVGQILKLPGKANKIYTQFQDFVKQICLKKGHNFKAGLKFPDNVQPQNQSKIIIRVTQKLFKKQLNKKSSDIQNKVNQYLQTVPTISIPTLTKTYFKVWKQIITQILNERIKSKIQTPCYIFDLARAKCMFNSIYDLEQTADRLFASCKKQGYRLIQCKNRLKKQTRDLNIKIQLKGIVCQLQLAMQFDTSLNEFAHGIYEIMRSPGGCIFGSIIWLGKMKRINFILDIQRLYKQIEQIESQDNQIIEKKTDFEYLLNQFKKLQ